MNYWRKLVGEYGGLENLSYSHKIQIISDEMWETRNPQYTKEVAEQIYMDMAQSFFSKNLRKLQVRIWGHMDMDKTKNLRMPARVAAAVILAFLVAKVLLLGIPVTANIIAKEFSKPNPPIEQVMGGANYARGAGYIQRNGVAQPYEEIKDYTVAIFEDTTEAETRQGQLLFANTMLGDDIAGM